MMNITRRGGEWLGSSSGSLLCWMVMMAFPLTTANADVPLPDLVLYGKVYSPEGDQQLGNLQSVRIAAFAARLGKPEEWVNVVPVATTDQLVDGGSGDLELYVLRLKRHLDIPGDFQAEGDGNYVLEDDVLHIYVDWDDGKGYQEVIETNQGDVRVSDSLSDVRELHLNEPSADGDDDGLPDAWEIDNLGGTGQGPGDDLNGDGMSNFLSYAFGLDPNADNSAKMPFLQVEEDGGLIFTYRESVEVTGLSYSVQESTSLTLTSDSWQEVTGAVIAEDSIDGGSRIFKVSIPGDIEDRKRLFRLSIIRD